MVFLASDDANHITGQTEVTWAKWSTGNVSFSDGFSLLGRYVDEEERFSVEQIVATRIRYGCRRVHVMLKREGWQVGRSVVYRLYREEGLTLRTKQPRRRKMVVHRQARLPAQGAERSLELGSLTPAEYLAGRGFCMDSMGPCKSEANAAPGHQSQALKGLIH